MRFGRTLPSDRRGVALPLALFAVIATAVLLAALLVSAATEVVISGAHQDAARDLYRLEAAIEAHVQAGGTGLLPGAHDSALDPEVRITVRRLAWTPVPDEPGRWHSTLSLTAQRRSGGRRLSAMVLVDATPESEAGVGAGGDAESNEAIVTRTFAWSEGVR